MCTRSHGVLGVEAATLLLLNAARLYNMTTYEQFMSLVEKLDEVSDEHDSQEWRDEVNHGQRLLRAMAGHFTEIGTDREQNALLVSAGFSVPFSPGLYSTKRSR